MCYQNDYMRDFFYYNQNPNQNMNMNHNYMLNNYMYRNNNNIESLYPNIYRILMPVVKKVVAGSNFQYLTEEVVSNIVDTVYNIVEGDRNVRTVEVNAEPVIDVRRSNSSGSSNTTQTQTTTQSRTNNSNNNNTTEYNTLLKDLIRILVLQEIARIGCGRNNMSMNMNTNANMNQNMNQYQNQMYHSCCNGMGYM